MVLKCPITIKNVCDSDPCHMYAIHVLQGEDDVFVANVFVMRNLTVTIVAVQHRTEVVSVVTGRYICRLEKIICLFVCLRYGLASQSTAMVMSGRCFHFMGCASKM